jgi:hypothetical protein
MYLLIAALHLQKLENSSGFVNLLSVKQVTAVVTLCPNLRVVKFEYNQSTEPNDVISPHQLQSLLSKLEKV